MLELGGGRWLGGTEMAGFLGRWVFHTWVVAVRGRERERERERMENGGLGMGKVGHS